MVWAVTGHPRTCIAIAQSSRIAEQRIQEAAAQGVRRFPNAGSTLNLDEYLDAPADLRIAGPG
jgi:hypothetical protein